jgi:hypothetical protein
VAAGVAFLGISREGSVKRRKRVVKGKGVKVAKKHNMQNIRALGGKRI